MSPTSSTQQTIKKLFSLSGNKCAFPNCNNPIVETENNSLTGIICHIKARNANGPRYDENQTDDERNSFENLILMCPIHHKVIDDDIISYTVERLLEIKRNHESQAIQEEPSDTIINTIMVNLLGNVIVTRNNQEIHQKLQLFFNRLSHFLHRLIKGELSRIFIRDTVRDLNMNQIKQYFEISVTQTNRGHYNTIDILNGNYLIRIESHIEGTTIEIIKERERLNEKDFTQINQILAELQALIQVNYGYDIQIPSNIPNCILEIDLRDRSPFLIGDSRGYRSIELGRRFHYQIKNQGSNDVFLNQLIVQLGEETINTLNMENTELSPGRTSSGFYEEEDIQSLITINPPYIIRLYVRLKSNENFYSNLIEF